VFFLANLRIFTSVIWIIHTE